LLNASGTGRLALELKKKHRAYAKRVPTSNKLILAKQDAMEERRNVKMGTLSPSMYFFNYH
jgi:hypothetical protein